MHEGYDYAPGDDHTTATMRYAGPFCSCGDYSCPASSSDVTCPERDTTPIEDPWCPCGITGCAAHHTDAPCTYPPEHPIHH